MIFSYSKNFLFIHNYKVAGTSIRDVLKKYSYRPHEKFHYQVFRRLGIIPSYHTFRSHGPILEVKNRMPSILFNRLFKFGFVRNPWDWQVSLYHFAQQTENHHQHELISQMNFEEYIQWRVNEDLHLQKDFFTDEKGEIIMDFIGKMESLEEDFSFVARTIGMDETLSHKNKSNHTHYRKYYSTKTKDLVYRAFLEDINTFGYEF
ncbi:MAG: sulfotransferase family protein [Flavobacteriales bacterium]|nr:sulfotransferase family protein [Flavobacteriales bacterium]